MAKTLYLECASGISGDMTVGALLDLGADQEGLKKALDSLPLDGYGIFISRVKKAGLSACDFDVRLEVKNHDHDMEYLHGEHSHGEHSHGGHSHRDHTHRGMKEIREIINAGALSERTRALALRIFEILAEAEAKAHGVPVEQVHFHEVGAVDSIVDIVAAAYCLDNLGITDVVVTRLCEGQGTVRCQHGILPIPVPAVANITAAEGLPLTLTDVHGELVTPTGAAIAAAVRTKRELPGEFTIKKVGVGAGKRDYACAGILRAMLIEPLERKKDTVVKLETNIDDCTGENLGYVMGLLLERGARDVFYSPVYMKKNRPAWLLTVICQEADRNIMEEIIFRETTTIGIRRQEMERTVLERQIKTVDTPLGTIDVKLCKEKERTYAYPEYESLVRLCREKGISYKEALRTAWQYSAQLTGETD